MRYYKPDLVWGLLHVRGGVSYGERRKVAVTGVFSTSVEVFLRLACRSP